MKWASADNPKKIATVNPTGVLKRTTGGEKVVPGGPDIYVAVMGREKLLLSARTTIICPRCRKPANKFALRRRFTVGGFLMS